MPKRLKLLEELRDINERYGVVFKGPIPAFVWEKEFPDYADCFQQILQIGRRHFDEYGGSEHDVDFGVDEKKVLTHELIQKAYQCRHERLNEEGWIREIEPKVVLRLGKEVIW